MTSPGGYQTDPRWLAAHAEYVRDTASDETPTDAFKRQLNAAMAMHNIESEAAAAVDTPAAPQPAGAVSTAPLVPGSAGAARPTGPGTVSPP